MPKRKVRSDKLTPEVKAKRKAIRKTRTAKQPGKLPTSTLTSAFNRLEPSWREYINYVQMSANEGNKDMKRFYENYLNLDQKDQRNYTPEQLCEQANISPADLVGEVTRQVWRAMNYDAGIITAINHPKVIAKTVKSALGDKFGAQQDRTNFLKATGFIPMPKPSIFAHEISVGQLSGGTHAPVRLPSHAEEMKLLDTAESEPDDPINAEVIEQFEP